MLPVKGEFQFVPAENEPKVSTEDIENRAKQLIQEAVAVQQSDSTRQKTTRCADGTFKTVSTPVSAHNAELKEKRVEALQIIAQLEKAFAEIDFNPRYEDLIPRTIPVDKAKPMIDLLLKLQKVHLSIEGRDRHTDKWFFLLAKPWMDKFVFTIKSAAQTSRYLQLEALRENPSKSKDYELDEVTILAHIERLVDIKHPKYYLEILMSLLNLKNLSDRDRKPTMDEQQAFRFLCKIDA